MLLVALVGCDGDPSSPEPDVGAVRISPDRASLQPGQTEMFIATAWTGSAEVPRRDITWSISDTMIAVVSPAGEVTARGAGEAVLRATVAGITGVADVVVLSGEPGPVAAAGR